MEGRYAIIIANVVRSSLYDGKNENIVKINFTELSSLGKQQKSVRVVRE